MLEASSKVKKCVFSLATIHVQQKKKRIMAFTFSTRWHNFTSQGMYIGELSQNVIATQ